MSGWIKLHRQIVTSSKFADADILRLWIMCLTKAAHKEQTVIVERQEIKLKPGQFVTGRFALSHDYNNLLSKNKRIKDTTLWNWLKRLESWGDIDIKSTNKYSVVTVLKWDEYQEDLTTNQQQTDSKLITNWQQNDTNKNEKNEKNEKKEEIKDCSPDGAAKIEFAPLVFMTEVEHQKLLELVGGELDDYFIRYGSWISGQTARVQKSRNAYLTIRNWWREDQKRRGERGAIHQGRYEGVRHGKDQGGSSESERAILERLSRPGRS